MGKELQLNPNQQVNIDLRQTQEVVCKECGSKTFQEVVMLRKVSALLAGKESYVPIPVFECSKCGIVPEEFLPKF